jgi:hypothetical protein
MRSLLVVALLAMGCDNEDPSPPDGCEDSYRCDAYCYRPDVDPRDCVKDCLVTKSDCHTIQEHAACQQSECR